MMMVDDEETAAAEGAVTFPNFVRCDQTGALGDTAPAKAGHAHMNEGSCKCPCDSPSGRCPALPVFAKYAESICTLKKRTGEDSFNPGECVCPGFLLTGLLSGESPGGSARYQEALRTAKEEPPFSDGELQPVPAGDCHTTCGATELRKGYPGMPDNFSMGKIQNEAVAKNECAGRCELREPKKKCSSGMFGSCTQSDEDDPCDEDETGKRMLAAVGNAIGHVCCAAVRECEQMEERRMISKSRFKELPGAKLLGPDDAGGLFEWLVKKVRCGGTIPWGFGGDDQLFGSTSEGSPSRSAWADLMSEEEFETIFFGVGADVFGVGPDSPNLKAEDCYAARSLYRSDWFSDEDDDDDDD